MPITNNPDNPNPATDNVAVSLRGVSFGYGSPAATVRRAAVHDFAADLLPGRITAVVGPNAAGKTTLLRLMLGQLEPWTGRIVVRGREVGRMDALERARVIAYVPQRGGVQFAFTVRQVVQMGRFACGGDAGVAEAIDRCDLHDVVDRPYTQLSGGQQQRVMLARAAAQLHGGTAGGVRVLLADEPVSSMDVRHQLRMMRLLRSLAAGGVAVLVVLHDLNLAAKDADFVWLMQEGRLIAAGPWSTVLLPAKLAAVYGVELRVMGQTRGGRPVLAMEDAATMPQRVSDHEADSSGASRC